MNALAPSFLSVLRVRAALVALALLAASIGAGLLLREHPAFAWPILGVGALLAVWLPVAVPGRQYRSWGYRAEEDELHVQSGVWTRSRTAVPFGRVQHIDLSQGPVERRYGVATLTLHTAGTRNSAVSLPGLALADAETMRDEIRARIRQDLM